MAIEQSQQFISESPEIEARKLGLIDEAKILAGSPINLPAFQVAGMSPQQLTAEQLAQAGIGAYRPYLDAAGQGIAQGQNLAQTGARGVAGINVARTLPQHSAPCKRVSDKRDKWVLMHKPPAQACQPWPKAHKPWAVLYNRLHSLCRPT